MSSVLFIPNLGKKRAKNEPMWGAELFAQAFREHSEHYIHIEYSLDNLVDYDLIWVHNVANLLKGVKGRLDLALMSVGNYPPMIGGVTRYSHRTE